ncbi:MAG: hypothetical protein LBS63_01900 [Prevotellaceae bacterium]|jgi:DNA modification methylase|nr:hypothetical protein [Prevotellaceae bacterium]
MALNKLILGDNLEILKTMESETVDLIYLDPPFFSNRSYEVIWGDDGEVRSFQDRWSGGIDHAAADKLNRKWIGIDQSVQAVKVTELRLNVQTDLFTNLYANSYILQLHKYDYDTLFNQNPFEFESWIIGQ